MQQAVQLLGKNIKLDLSPFFVCSSSLYFCMADEGVPRLYMDAAADP